VKKEKPKEEPSSHFQRQRVDMLLGELLRKFPIPQAMPADQANKPDEDKTASNKNESKSEPAPTIKQEPMDTNTNDSVSSQIQIKQEPSSGPPEKKPKLNN
jgi:mediator of RNA polymerase II transcription subunit 6